VYQNNPTACEPEVILIAAKLLYWLKGGDIERTRLAEKVLENNEELLLWLGGSSPLPIRRVLFFDIRRVK